MILMILMIFTIWISIDLTHKILKDLKWFCGFQQILWIVKTHWKKKWS